MSQKTVWLTWMPTDEPPTAPQSTVAEISRVGLAGAGAPWVDAPDDFAWTELAEKLKEDGGPDVWLIAARASDLANPNHRFGLSMVASIVEADCDRAPHVALLGLDGMPDADALPTRLRGSQLLDGKAAGWAAKLVVAANLPAKASSEVFRMRANAQKMLGMWLEVGPRAKGWKGAMVGVAGDAKITNHAVGPKGGLPEKTVLEYKLEGIELEIGDNAFVAWAVANELGDGDSYYVKIEGTPTHVLVGEHPDSDPEVSVLTM